MVLEEYTGSNREVADLSLARYSGDGQLTKIAPYAFKEHRELVEVNLPRGIEELGNHAFYNCRNLSRLSFFDDLLVIGEGAFMNCTRLREVIISNANGDFRGIKEILSKTKQGILVSFYGNWLFFPHFEEEFQDNDGARIVAEITHGAGCSYRAVLDRENIDYITYDNFFAEKKYAMEFNEAILIARTRLLYPEELRDEKREEYLSFLSKNKRELILEIAEKKDIDLLDSYLKLGIFNEVNELDSAIDSFCEMDFAVAVEKLLDYRKKNYTKNILDMEF